MSAEQTPDIERVLAEHTYMLQMSKGAICLCGFVPTVDADSLATQQDYHRAHVAQALAPVLAAAVREAKAEALREAARDMKWHGIWAPDESYLDSYEPSHYEWLLARADRVAEPQHEAATSGEEASKA